jgi:hypothetical protein
LFKKAPKKEPPEFRAPPVEAKRELVEVRLEVIDLYGPLVGSEQPAFEEAGDAVNPGKDIWAGSLAPATTWGLCR